MIASVSVLSSLPRCRTTCRCAFGARLPGSPARRIPTFWDLHTQQGQVKEHLCFVGVAMFILDDNDDDNNSDGGVG